jgi:hypothetical protein
METVLLGTVSNAPHKGKKTSLGRNPELPEIRGFILFAGMTQNPCSVPSIFIRIYPSIFIRQY